MRYFKIFALTVFFLIKCNFLFAQKDLTDSTKTYEYWSKRGIIEVVYAYMNDYITTVTDSSLHKEKIKDCTKEKTSLKEFENLFISPLENMGNEEIFSKLNEISKFLKGNNWSGAEKNVLQPLIVNLKNQKVLTIDFFNTQKSSGNIMSTHIPGYNNKLSKWNVTVERIISDYNNDLKKISIVKDSESGTTIHTDKSRTNRGGTELETPILTEQNWIIGLSILFSFLCGVFIVYYYINSKIYFIYEDDDIETYNNSTSNTGLFSFISMVRLLKKRKDFYKNKVAELEGEIEKLKSKSLPVNHYNSKASGDTIDIEKSSDIAEYSAKSIELDLSKEGGNKTSLYFSIPESDGRFIIDKGEQINDGSKYYKIEYLNNSDEGDLFYISGNQDKRAINRLDSYLKPVCDIDNVLIAESANKIKLNKEGKVKLNGDSWQMTVKVNIGLE